MERGHDRRPRVQTWNPPLVLNGSPFLLDSSIRDFQKRKAGYMANALEHPLLLPDNMADLRTMKEHEVFLTLKRDLALVSFSFSLLFFFLFFFFKVFQLFQLIPFFFFTKAIQATHMAEELVNNSHRQMKEEDGRCIATVEAFTLAK